MGRISDALKSTYGVDSLRYAATGCTIFYVLAAVLALLAVKSLRNSWVDDRSHD
jgi:hypothetical protein